MLITFLALIQDTQSTSPLQAALERAAQAGSIRVEGAVVHASTLDEWAQSDENPWGQWTGNMGQWTGEDGFFHGTIAPSGDFALTYETETSSVESFRRGEAVVHRMTWREQQGGMGAWQGMPQGLGPEARRVLTLRGLAEIAGRLENVQEREQEDGRRVFTAEAPAEWVRGPQQESEPQVQQQGENGGQMMVWNGGNMEEYMSGPIERVTVTAWIDPESGDLARLRVDVEHGAPQWWAQWGEQMRQWMDIPDEYESTSSYEVEIAGVQEEGIEYPEEIERRFE